MPGYTRSTAVRLIASSRRDRTDSRSPRAGASANRGLPVCTGTGRFQLRKPSAATRSKRRLSGESTRPPKATYTPGSRLDAAWMAARSVGIASLPSRPAGCERGGEHDRHRGLREQPEQERGGPGEGVGAVRDDDARRLPLPQVVVHRREEARPVLGRDLLAQDPAQLDLLEGDAARQTPLGLEQAHQLGRIAGSHVAGLGDAAGDRPAERQHLDHGDRELRAHQLLHQAGVRPARRGAHDLADEEGDRSGVAAPDGLHHPRVRREHGVDVTAHLAAVGDLLPAPSPR